MGRNRGARTGFFVIERHTRYTNGPSLLLSWAGSRSWLAVLFVGLIGITSQAEAPGGQKQGTEATKPAVPGAPVPPRPRSSRPTLSADGRIVVFQSTSTLLVPGDTSGTQHVYAYDRTANRLQRISSNASGQPGNKLSLTPSVSGDGRFVVFASDATNLVPGDTNEKQDIFLFDRKTSEISRVSLTSGGLEPNDHCREPAISADGKFVAFVSTATNFVKEDLNLSADVFLHERDTRITRRVSVTSDGEEADHASGEPALSDHGRFVAFFSHARNLAAKDTNNAPDIYLHDVKTGRTEIVSVASNQVIGDRNSHLPSISGDGQFVAFESWASNFASGDANGAPDIFVRDIKAQKTFCVSITPGGGPAGDDSRDPRITSDGRYVAFTSYATNLVPNDTNRKSDIFLHDRKSGKTEMINRSHTREQANKRNGEPAVSADGRFVAFTSKASNLVPDDKDKALDVFLVDRKSGEIRRISAPPADLKKP